MKKMKKIKITILAVFLIFLSALILFNLNENFARAQANQDVQEIATNPTIGNLEDFVCCEKTKSGLFCQDVPQDECADTSRAIPTSCAATALCKPGWCFDSFEGTCLDGVASSVCSDNNGTWFANKPPACELGCCFLGDQGSFVTLTRCKAMSAGYGIETNFNTDFKDEPSCILAAAAKEKGACVFVKDFERTCKLTARGDCKLETVLRDETKKSESGSGTSQVVRGEDVGLQRSQQNQNTQQNQQGAEIQNNQNGQGITGQVVSGFENQSVEFFPGKLCSAEELNTNCGLSKQTTCIPGKQEVYFVDTCGNPANIYDASKVNDKKYWSDIIKKEDSCKTNDANINSQTCGNCNYLGGSYCREKSSDTATPTYGNFICASLNCKDTDGKQKLHGESWCGFDENSPEGVGRNSVGSKFYRYQCNNGAIVVEPCAEFRQEECIQNTLETPFGPFTEAACRVNRWQDCTAQRDAQSCLNSDRRDCIWLNGIEYVLMGSVLNAGGGNGSSSISAEGSLAGIGKRASQAIKEIGGIENIPKGACVPKNPPGLKFWEGQEAANVCSQANAVCPVTYEKGILSDEWKCKEHCECLPGGELEFKRAQLCVSMGDCGPNVNIGGQFGNTKGYKVFEQELGKKK